MDLVSLMTTFVRIADAEARAAARRATELGDDGTNDLLVSDIIRTNEMHVWFLSEHLVDQPLAHTE